MKTAKDLRDFDSLFQLLDYFKPKEDVRIENGKPKFNSVLSSIVNKKPKTNDDTSAK